MRLNEFSIGELVTLHGCVYEVEYVSQHSGKVRLTHVEEIGEECDPWCKREQVLNGRELDEVQPNN